LGEFRSSLPLFLPPSSFFLPFAFFDSRADLLPFLLVVHQFALGSAATLCWINSPRHSNHAHSWCESRSYSLAPSTPTESEPTQTQPQTVVADSKDRDSQGRRFGGWRRRREEEELSRKVMEEKWKADSERMVKSAEEAKEKVS